MKKYSYSRYNALNPPPCFCFETDELGNEIEGTFINREGKPEYIYRWKETSTEKREREYWEIRHDPNRGLMYYLRHIDEFDYTSLLEYHKLELKSIKESGLTLDQIDCLPKFCCFVGDGEHYIVYNKKALYSIAIDIQRIFNKMYFKDNK